MFNELVREPQYKTFVDRRGSMRGDGEVDMDTEERRQCQATFPRRAVKLIRHKARMESDYSGCLLNSVMEKRVLK